MGLFISERIRKREFGKLIPAPDKAILLDGAHPDLTQPIAGKDLPKGTRLHMSPKNAAFSAELNRHLDLLREDILENRVEEILSD